MIILIGGEHVPCTRSVTSTLHLSFQLDNVTWLRCRHDVPHLEQPRQALGHLFTRVSIKFLIYLMKAAYGCQ